MQDVSREPDVLNASTHAARHYEATLLITDCCSSYSCHCCMLPDPHRLVPSMWYSPKI